MNEICNRFPDPGIQSIPRTYKYHVSCRHNWFLYRDDLHRVSNPLLVYYDLLNTPSACCGELHSFFAKGFEFIADLNNWGKLKTSQDEFVNLFIIYTAIKKQTRKW